MIWIGISLLLLIVCFLVLGVVYDSTLFYILMCLFVLAAMIFWAFACEEVCVVSGYDTEVIDGQSYLIVLNECYIPLNKENTYPSAEYMLVED